MGVLRSMISRERLDSPSREIRGTQAYACAHEGPVCVRAQAVLEWATPRLSHSQWDCLSLGLLLRRWLHHVRRTVPTARHRHSQQPGTPASQEVHSDRAALPPRSVLAAERLQPHLPKQIYPRPRLARSQYSTTRYALGGSLLHPFSQPFLCCALQPCVDGGLAVLLLVGVPSAVRVLSAVLFFSFSLAPTVAVVAYHGHLCTPTSTLAPSNHPGVWGGGKSTAGCRGKPAATSPLQPTVWGGGQHGDHPHLRSAVVFMS